MSKVRKVSAKELDSMLQPKMPSPRTIERRKAIERFKEFLLTLAPGEGGEIKLEPNENRQLIKKRLLRAAEELNMELEFIRKRKRIVFRVVPPAGENRSEDSDAEKA